ncbi:MAG: ABC transporter permease [Aridibacter famidurans]|nr:ABC transporter permease [Aridibacter famidurans]
MVARIPVTIRLIGEHLFLTGVAVALAILIAVPLGIYLTRNERFSGLVIGTTGVIQTIPSLALLAFMIPIPGFGLSMRSAIAALFLYALLPIVRNTFTGIKEVDADLIEAAEGMGLKENQILRHVQLPLAIPTIMAGVRTAAVISVGVATLAAFIGAGGLGEPILTGLQLNEPRLILAGAIPAALLALSVDGLLGLADRLLAPSR